MLIKFDIDNTTENDYLPMHEYFSKMVEKALLIISKNDRKNSQYKFDI